MAIGTRIEFLTERPVPLDEDLVILTNASEAQNFKITLADLKIALGDLSVATLTTLLDTVGDTMYVGKALPGSLPSEAKWSIQRVTTVVDDLQVEWASSGAFTQVWDNRLSLSYA